MTDDRECRAVSRLSSILWNNLRDAVGGYAAYRRAVADQWIDPETTRSRQQAKLRSIVAHAYSTVPYYRRLFDDAGCRPRDIRSVDDLARLPLTEKADLQTIDETERLSSSFRRDQLASTRTSGAIGRPFTAFREHSHERRRTGFFLRALATAGYRLGDRLMMVVDGEQRPASAWTRWTKLSIEQPPEQMFELLNRYRPDVLYGFVSSIRQLARMVREHGSAHRPPVVVTVSESLDATTRRLLVDTFGAEVFEVYGSVEFGTIAWECPAHDGYHIAEDSVLVETIPAGSDGSCRLVLTDLNCRAMPMIRYDLGDLSRLAPNRPCACGRPSARLQAIEGRAIDGVCRPDGSFVSPLSLTGTLAQVQSILRFQVLQEDLRAFRVRLEEHPGLAQDIDRQVTAAVRSVIGQTVEVTIERVPTLEPPRGRKFRIVENRVRLAREAERHLGEVPGGSKTPG
jgi:phenylacetate-CoA ligase